MRERRRAMSPFDLKARVVSITQLVRLPNPPIYHSSINEKDMSIIQALRRVDQQLHGWRNAMNMQDYQLRLIQKLFAKNGLQIKMTCPACPEQYDIFKDGEQVAYFRLRHGVFRVDYPECGGETILEAEPNGDGIFDDNERLNHLVRAMRTLLCKLTDSDFSTINESDKPPSP